MIFFNYYAPDFDINTVPPILCTLFFEWLDLYRFFSSTISRSFLFYISLVFHFVFPQTHMKFHMLYIQPFANITYMTKKQIKNEMNIYIYIAVSKIILKKKMWAKKKRFIYLHDIYKFFFCFVSDTCCYFFIWQMFTKKICMKKMEISQRILYISTLIK